MKTCKIVCAVLLANVIASMMIYLEVWNDGSPEPSGFWYTYSLVGMIIGFIALAALGGYWSYHKDKLLFAIYTGGVAAFFLASFISVALNNGEPSDFWNLIVALFLFAGVARAFTLDRRQMEELIRVSVELTPKQVRELAFHTCGLFTDAHDSSLQFGYQFSGSVHAYHTFGNEASLGDLTAIGYKLLGSIKSLPGVSEVMYGTYCFNIIVDESFDRDDVLVEVLDLMASLEQELIVSLYDLTNHQAQNDEDREIYIGPYSREGVKAKLMDLEAV